jgi:saccharopine dehydrogenase-like NADP-dependent oxidoreductase
MRILVLGGAGKMGCLSVQALAKDKRVDEVVIADINHEQAEQVVNYLDSKKVKIMLVDIHDQENFVKSLAGYDACLNATVYYTNLMVMEACLKAGVSYTDMGGLFHTTRQQLKKDQDFRNAGISAVLGMGSAPGIPNVQSRYAADRMDTIRSIKIYDGVKPPPPADVRFTYAVPTILDELTQPPMVFRNGEFMACEPMSEFEDYWFTPPLGLLPMHLSLHSEVATLPITFQEKGVEEVFFKINHWGMSKETVNKVKVVSDFGFNGKDPIEVSGQKVVPHDLLLALFSKYVPSVVEILQPPVKQPPDWAKEIITEVDGTRDGKNVIYRIGTLTVKGSLPTGVAPAIAAIWLAEGRIPKGVHPPEAVLKPEDFFKELEAFQIYTQVSKTEML